MCGGDYYNPDWPLEKKLGGLCMVIGHEITHAFDTRGARYDKDGNVKNWWTEKDMAEFAKRVDKLNAYYSALVPAPQISDAPYGIEGAERISGEAIADLGSMKCLLSVAKKQNSFDYEMFFSQAAVIQRLAIYEKDEMKYIAADPHPVYSFRCNIPVQNFDEFIETFGVKEGDGMYLAPKDRVAIW
jgi:putative endopeptidase